MAFKLLKNTKEEGTEKVASKKNYLGNSFRPDFSSPSTHLLYGYWVGATPDGRRAREMLNYGVDPLYGEASGGLGLRMLSNRRLPFDRMCGGCASHFGMTILSPNFDARLFAVLHVRLCTVTVPSEARNPTTLSPGIGLQHDAIIYLCPESSFEMTY